MKNIQQIVFLSTFIFAGYTEAQWQDDTLKSVNLPQIIIKDNKAIGGMERMPDIKDNVIYAGKKTEVIQLDKINADLSMNNTRQVFAKVPGLSIWENDGSGIQAGIAARGLSPNRSWEFNVRQNGYDISSEVFGYPETYYTPPMEALKKIEVIRGAASLQFGPQFGGVINYQMKKGNPNKPFSFETSQTLGSYGMFNSFNAIGGTRKKFSYYAFLHNRTAEGWRKNSFYTIYTAYISASYQLSKKINISGEFTKMTYKSQQAGGLSEAQFNDNARLSSRERNWFSAPFNVASLTFKYDFTPALNLSIKSFATFAQRNSVGFTKGITVKDSINPATLQYAARQVDRDNYANYGSELRLSYKYKLFGLEHALAGGIRAYSGNTQRNQQGVGTTSDDFDLTLTSPNYGRALEFGTINYAAFAENIFQVGKRIKIVPGIRFEYIDNKTSGYINTSASGTISSDRRVRQIILYGIGTEFHATEKTTVYANYSTAYRPVTFSELTPSATTEIIDPNLKDASGFNADFGYRGTVGNYLNFDVGAFYLHYDNRIGTLTQNGAPFKTNIGTSVSKGLESFIEIDIMKIFNESPKYGSVSLFASNSLIDAKYTRWNNDAIANDPTKSILNKRVENAPEFIHRFGATYYVNNFSATFQLSAVGDVFTDAANTVLANSSATIGKLDGYQVMDVSFSYKFLEHYHLKGGVNNMADKKYATRRAGGYPGPGILPGNGRTLFLTIGANI